MFFLALSLLSNHLNNHSFLQLQSSLEAAPCTFPVPKDISSYDKIHREVYADWNRAKRNTSIRTEMTSDVILRIVLPLDSHILQELRVFERLCQRIASSHSDGAEKYLKEVKTLRPQGEKLIKEVMGSNRGDGEKLNVCAQHSVKKDYLGHRLPFSTGGRSSHCGVWRHGAWFPYCDSSPEPGRHRDTNI